jgi:hypothetical protein
MTHEKERRRKPEKEGWELLGLAVAAMGPSHHAQRKHRACQLSAAPSSPQIVSARIVRRAQRRPRASCCLASATLLALCLLAPSQARAQQTDKLLHASASAVIVDVVWASAALCEQPLAVRLGAAVGVAAAAGVGKELVDAAGFGTPDAADLLFDAFGIGVGVALALVVEALWPHAPAAGDGEAASAD